MCQRSRGAVLDEAAVVENFLELRGRGGALATGEAGFAAYISRIDAVKLRANAQLVWFRDLNLLNCNASSLAIDCELTANGG
jgi:hypothetical protein